MRNTVRGSEQTGVAERHGRHWIFNPVLLLAMRLVLAAMFIYAALQKIGHPLQFSDEIRMYHILDIGSPLYITAIVLPWIELFCGISLVTGVFIRGSALILAVLNLVFLVFVSIRTVQVMNDEGIGIMKVYFDCGCGFGETYAWKKLLEDTLLCVFSLVLVMAPKHRFTIVRSRR